MTKTARQAAELKKLLSIIAQGLIVWKHDFDRNNNLLKLMLTGRRHSLEITAFSIVILIWILQDI